MNRTEITRFELRCSRCCYCVSYHFKRVNFRRCGSLTTPEFQQISPIEAKIILSANKLQLQFSAFSSLAIGEQNTRIKLTSLQELSSVSAHDGNRSVLMRETMKQNMATEEPKERALEEVHWRVFHSGKHERKRKP